MPLVAAVALVSSCVRGLLFLISLSVQEVRVLSALVRVLEVPADECPLKRPWRSSLLVSVVHFFLFTSHVQQIYTVVL